VRADVLTGLGGKVAATGTASAETQDLTEGELRYRKYVHDPH
jgi:hypothetical protein